MEKIDQPDDERYQIAFKMSSGHVIQLCDWPEDGVCDGKGDDKASVFLQIFDSVAHYNMEKGSDEPVVNISLEKGVPIDPDVDNGNATHPDDEKEEENGKKN